MRSQNTGWGQIAQKLGFKLGPVIAGMKSGNQHLAGTATTTPNPTAATNASSKSVGSDSGIVSASGKSHANVNQGVSNGKGSEDGIVTASGRATAMPMAGAILSVPREIQPALITAELFCARWER